MNPLKKFKTAVIGCGMISDIYFQNMIEKFDILEVVACSDLNSELAQEKAQKYGLVSLSAEEIIEDKSIEIVVNLTTPLVHYQIIKQMLFAGKHVYTEKVITPDNAQGQELVQLAKERNLRLGCAPDTFLGSAIQQGRRIIEQGIIGEVSSFHIFVNRDMGHLYQPNSFTVKPGGGIGFDVGIYYLTALLSIFGPVEKVAGISETIQPNHYVENPASPLFEEKFTVENENLMLGFLQFKNGISGTFHFNSHATWPEEPQVKIYGTEGILSLPDPNQFGGEVLLKAKGATENTVMPTNFGYTGNERGLGVAEMAWSIRNTRPHRASAEMAAHAIEVLTSIVNSAHLNQTQTLDTTFSIPEPLPVGYLTDYFLRSEEASLAYTGK